MKQFTVHRISYRWRVEGKDSMEPVLVLEYHFAPEWWLEDEDGDVILNEDF